MMSLSNAMFWIVVINSICIYFYKLHCDEYPDAEVCQNYGGIMKDVKKWIKELDKTFKRVIKEFKVSANKDGRKVKK